MFWSLFALATAAIVHPTALNAPLADYGAPIKVSQNIIDTQIATRWGPPYPSTNLTVPKDFDHVQLTLTFATDGRQYDRLGHILVDGIEVWRFSTPEPNFRTIQSTLQKDVSEFSPLFKDGATLELYLDNSLLEVGGILNVTVSAAYFSAPDNKDRAYQQWWYDSIPTKYVALQGTNEIASVPPKETLQIPQLSKNTTRAGIQISASGNSAEEFWYTNTLSSTGATRQLRLTIDGVVAGFIDPFEAAYTGAWYPDWWNSLAGVQSFDVPGYFVDISTFLPQLWAGSATLEVVVDNGYDSEVIGAQWLVNTALVLWQDPNEEAIGGHQNVITNHGDPVIQSWNGSENALDYTGLYNYVELSATLFFQNKSVDVSWSQKGRSHSAEIYTNDTMLGYTWQKGDTSIKYGQASYSQAYEYPRTFYIGDKSVGLYYYGYIVENSGSTSYTLNNTVYARNTQDQVGGNFTSHTDGYLGYIDTNGNAATEHMVATSKEISSDTRAGGYTLDTTNAWENLFSQADQAVRTDPASVAAQLWQFAKDLTGYPLLT